MNNGHWTATKKNNCLLSSKLYNVFVGYFKEKITFTIAVQRHSTYHIYANKMLLLMARIWYLIIKCKRHLTNTIILWEHPRICLYTNTIGWIWIPTAIFLQDSLFILDSLITILDVSKGYLILFTETNSRVAQKPNYIRFSNFA